MPIPVLIPPALRLILSTAIGAKIVGFVFSWVTSPTNHAMRTAFLDHVDHVIEGLDKAGIGIWPSERVSLIEDLAVLRDSAEVGWTEPHETSAIGANILVPFVGTYERCRRRSGIGSGIACEGCWRLDLEKGWSSSRHSVSAPQMNVQS
jgi:hypothetical protein